MVKIDEGKDGWLCKLGSNLDAYIIIFIVIMNAY